jgi:hypothetical protein
MAGWPARVLMPGAGARGAAMRARPAAGPPPSSRVAPHHPTRPRGRPAGRRARAAPRRPRARAPRCTLERGAAV